MAHAANVRRLLSASKCPASRVCCLSLNRVKDRQKYKESTSKHFPSTSQTQYTSIHPRPLWNCNCVVIGRLRDQIKHKKTSYTMSPRVKYSKMLGHIEFALEIRILIILMMKLQDAANHVVALYPGPRRQNKLLLLVRYWFVAHSLQLQLCKYGETWCWIANIDSWFSMFFDVFCVMRVLHNLCNCLLSQTIPGHFVATQQSWVLHADCSGKESPWILLCVHA